MATKTESGRFIVFHKSEAGSPDLFHKGEWYFEPANYEANEVYSDGYPTEQEALTAAENWEEQVQFEEQQRADEAAAHGI